MKNGYSGPIVDTSNSYTNSRNSRDRLQFDTTTPLSKAIKGILKVEGEGFSSDLTLDGERVGEVHVHKRPEGWNVIDVYIHPDERENGYGRGLFRDLNKKAYSEGSRLYVRERGDGGSVVVLPDGRGLLESFVKNGEAEKTDIGYRFKTGG